jgi:hypothetical protein
MLRRSEITCTYVTVALSSPIDNKPNQGHEVVRVRWRQILVSVNRRGPGRTKQGMSKRLQRKQSLVKKRIKVCPQPSVSSPQGACVVRKRYVDIFATLVVVGMQCPGAWFPAIGSPVLGSREKGKLLCHSPDLLNKGSLSRCRTPWLWTDQVQPGDVDWLLHAVLTTPHTKEKYVFLTDAHVGKPASFCIPVRAT